MDISTTVTQAATTYDLVTLAVVADDLGITDNTLNRFLQRSISMASAAIAKYCNNKFAVESLTDTIFLDQDPYPYQTPGGAKPLLLSRWPVISITSVNQVLSINQATTPPSNVTQTLVADQDYTSDNDRGSVIRLNAFTGVQVAWEALPTIVAYSAGYATIPLDVQDAVIRLVRGRWLARGRDPYLKSENIPGVADRSWWIPTVDGLLPPDIEELVAPYRVPVIG